MDNHFVSTLFNSVFPQKSEINKYQHYFNILVKTWKITLTRDFTLFLFINIIYAWHNWAPARVQRQGFAAETKLRVPLHPARSSTLVTFVSVRIPRENKFKMGLLEFIFSCLYFHRSHSSRIWEELVTWHVQSGSRGCCVQILLYFLL